MRDRGDLRPDADPRHLAVALVAAHQGGAMLTHVTGDPQPLRAAGNAAARMCAPSPLNRRRARGAPRRLAIDTNRDRRPCAGHGAHIRR